MNTFSKDRWVKDAIFAGYLRVDRDGRVYRNTAWGSKEPAWVEIIQQTHKPSGRVYFMLTWREAQGSDKKVRKSVLTNRAVALRYLPNPQNLPQVNHIDGVKAHNWLQNDDGTMQLEWSSGRDNELHAHANGLKSGRGSQNANVKLTAADVLAIRASANPAPSLARRYGVSLSTIRSILNGKTWSHL